jgi:hypothetical protein
MHFKMREQTGREAKLDLVAWVAPSRRCEANQRRVVGWIDPDQVQ